MPSGAVRMIGGGRWMVLDDTSFHCFRKIAKFKKRASALIAAGIISSYFCVLARK